MALPRAKRHFITLVLLMLLEISQISAKSTRPVTEIISETSRSDDKPRAYNNGLPYGNPLAGNQKQARLHAENQQAMFNAERVRKHRAQIQRWTKAPLRMDSYMKAYHESQENHQLALEQQQTVANSETQPNSRKLQLQQQTQTKAKHRGYSRPATDVIKITKDDAIIVNPNKNRNHRSYGSADSVYQQYLQRKKYQTSVYLSPGTTYDQGVTIKPNGNVGLTHLKTHEKEPQRYTEAIPSTTQYIYPKQYGQMQNYKSAQELDGLNSLLNNDPKDQVSSFVPLLNFGNHVTEEAPNENLDTPIDMFFYLKDNSNLHDHNYAQIPATYAGAYVPQFPEVKDHTPITEDINDIEDPSKLTKFKTYGLQSALATNVPQEQSVDTTTTKSNNYYKVEVASQTISAPYKSTNNVPVYYKENSYQPLHYKPVFREPLEGDSSERYLHHNVQPVGIHHLSEDGSVSAYGEENLQYAANYEFGYRVRDGHTGNDFGHHEAKQGDETRGHYHVLLPDGRMQQVKYFAGPEGFHADISYDHLHVADCSKIYECQGLGCKMFTAFGIINWGDSADAIKTYLGLVWKLKSKAKTREDLKQNRIKINGHK